MGGHHNTTKALRLSSPVLSHSVIYGVRYKEDTRRDCLQNFDAHHRTDRRSILDQPLGTAMKKDEDRLTLRTSELAAPLQLTTPQSETQNLNLLLSGDPPTPEPMEVVTVSATSGPVVEAPHLSRPWTCFRQT